MQLDSFYPVICTAKVAETSAFYIEHFGFTHTFEADWYVSLQHIEQPQYQLAVIDHTHPTVPENFRKPVQGLILNFEVQDVDAEYQRLIKEVGLPAHVDLRSEDFGMRHFITSDPSGVMIDVITLIPPSADFAKQYVEG
ncbi:MAG: glyoxalase/bleomycin resistance/extradiol dioxygenase family protein [Chloroflexi bacterium AL-W]|nr:glyoxalase/bleomycin resistance/extradiol dioxygenase family protein [Chloroflexi bacterium AL-N1]NOK70786.1 glyoxalase/bleomycin resistance/extradiol dioxygenase family protein [Chloroflexi bacterium AL-N10]NOK78346.1 glyoxalase/bleomycin resistance/extradiol dioxygenase family protein [Chloroflexi bacterium AL-N5]NOK85327.1 glyoxalase/bleomycin resistance/extradiol dioxygenase family protein [Chloroflexi bacterium AL-W]NOK92603.1 glyoxalase/bleomycin resistance/extradiol dioxygenase family